VSGRTTRQPSSTLGWGIDVPVRWGCPVAAADCGHSPAPEIPARPVKNEPDHLHLDLRYAFTVPHNPPVTLQDEEVNDFQWISIDQIEPANLRDKLGPLPLLDSARLTRRSTARTAVPAPVAAAST
jgi:hypothetical protein